MRRQRCYRIALHLAASALGIGLGALLASAAHGAPPSSRGAATMAASSAPTVAAPSTSGASTLKIIQYLNPRSSSDLVMIGGHSSERLLAGELLEAYRPADVVSGIREAWVPTGTMKVISVQGSVAIARVDSAPTTIARTVFPKHPHVMAGDVVAPKRVTIAPIQTVLQEATILYRSIFVDPKGRPTTFELTDVGRAKLLQIAADLAGAHVTVLMVEAYTDKNGNSDANQIESYERALTVRQFLINELGFDEARVVAVGYGETEQVSDNAVAGYRDRNRRVVLKVLGKG